MKHRRSFWSWGLAILFGFMAAGSCVGASGSGVRAGLPILYVAALGWAALTSWAWNRGNREITGWLSQRKLAIVGTLLVVVPYLAPFLFEITLGRGLTR